MQLTINHDRQKLEQLEEIINKNLQSLYDVGMALIEIRDRELYKIKDKGKYQTFAAYCRSVWDISRPRAYQLIGAARVQENLSTFVDKIIPESQARALVKLEPQQQREAWQKAMEAVPVGKVTAAYITKIARTFQVPKIVIETIEEGEDSDYLLKLKDLWKSSPRNDQKKFIQWVKNN